MDNVLVTPAARFAALPDFNFASHFCRVHDGDIALNMHYVDEGPRDKPVALLLHGEPTWSFLYRKIIPVVARAGYRVVAPDYIGFGRSDKFATRSAYSYQKFVDWLCEFVTSLDLQRITMFCQDWGGPIGLRALATMPERFAAVLATNTLLPTAEPPPLGVADWPGTLIENWVNTCRNADDLPISELVAHTCVTRPSPEVLHGYDAPFPNASFKAAPLQITCLIPTHTHLPGIAENRAAWQVLENFRKPFLTAFSDSDPSTKAWEQVFRQRVPGAQGQPHCEIKGAGHFVQEEKGAELAEVLVELMNRTYR